MLKRESDRPPGILPTEKKAKDRPEIRSSQESKSYLFGFCLSIGIMMRVSFRMSAPLSKTSSRLFYRIFAPKAHCFAYSPTGHCGRTSPSPRIPSHRGKEMMEDGGARFKRAR